MSDTERGSGRRFLPKMSAQEPLPGSTPLGKSRFNVAVRDAERQPILNTIVICHAGFRRCFVVQWLHLTSEWLDQEPSPRNCWIRMIRDQQVREYLYRLN